MPSWPKESFGRGLTGLYFIYALAAHAADDDLVCRYELGRFVETARCARGSIELFQGMAGVLAGAATVMRSIHDPDVRVSSREHRRGDRDTHSPAHDGLACARAISCVVLPGDANRPVSASYASAPSAY